MLNNTHVIVQQPTGQQVLIQAPQHQELIMRQGTAIQQQGINIHSYNNRVVYTTSPQQQQQQQHVLQQHVQQQQQQQLQLQGQTPHLVQTRVVPQQAGNVVYQQVQMQKPPMQQQQQQQPQQQQVQVQQPQLVATATGAQLVRAPFRAKAPRGAAVIARQATGTVITRPMVTPTIVRQVRPRGGIQGAGSIIRAVRPQGVRPARTQLLVQTSTAGDGQTMQILTQTQLTKQLTITNLSPQTMTAPGQQMQPRHIYRQVVTEAPNNPQQQHQQMVLMRQPPIRYRTATPVPAALTPAASTSTMGLDLEERIQAAVVKKEQQQKPATGSSPMQMPAAGNTTLTTYYQPGSATTSGSEDDQQQQPQQQQPHPQQQPQQQQPQLVQPGVRTPSGASMSLAEFKKRQTMSGSPAPTATAGLSPMRHAAPGTLVRTVPKLTQPLPQQQQQQQQTVQTQQQQQQPQANPTTTVAGARILQQPPVQRVQPTVATPPQVSSVQQTSHNNYEIHSQHVLNNRAGQHIADRDRNSAKMLVILASGEQRLITFTLPRESCTVQDLLEQVSVPFDNTTTIQCVEHRGANVDFVVTVGFSVNESASELISRAEESLQMTRQQENAAAAAAAAAASASATAAATPAAALGSAAASTTTTTTPAYSQPSSSSSATGSEPVKRDATGTASPAAAAPTEGPKLIDGFYAVCHLCGFTGMDHAKCERCKRVFLEPPKRKSFVTKTTNASSIAAVSSAGELVTAADKKREIGRLTKVATYSTSNMRGRGMAIRGGRARSGRRVADVDPVVLLSSEDEADQDDSNADGSNVSETHSHQILLHVTQDFSSCFV